MTPKRTKIVCTIGPASSDLETLQAMVRAGMDVARVNLSHGTRAEHEQEIDSVRRAACKEGAIVGIMADLQGPKVRIGAVQPDPRPLQVGDRLVLASVEPPRSKEEIGFPHPEAVASLRPGDRLVIGDGEVELVVEERKRDALVCRVSVGGNLGSHKGVAVPPGTALGPALTPKDVEDVAFALAQGVDFLALSFVRSAADVAALRQYLPRGPDQPGLVAKIEKREALEDFSAILDQADAVMVARGDLGTEVPVEEVPFHQKEIIRLSNASAKPVITATQVLQSMIDHALPTRAEASDAANAILDGTDAVMLSGETAVGHYPVLAVETLARIASAVEERMLGSVGRPAFADASHREPVADAISNATATIARELGARLILTSTTTGYTARMVARERPGQPIVAATSSLRVARRLALSWGVLPLFSPQPERPDALAEGLARHALERGLASKGDLVLVTGGLPQGGGGRTNFLRVDRL